MSSRQVWRFWWMASSVSCTMSSHSSGPSPAPRDRAMPRTIGATARRKRRVGARVAAVRRTQQVVERRLVRRAHSIPVRSGGAAVTPVAVRTLR